MFSTLTERGAAATLDALALGASDYVTKPSNTGSAAVAIERIRVELLPKIKALCGAAPLKLQPLPGARPGLPPRPPSNPRIEIVAIGTRTERVGGGLAEDSARFSRSDCSGATHAANLHSSVGGPAGEPLGNQR
jgi:chemotaxis response regulator CheB